MSGGRHGEIVDHPFEVWEAARSLVRRGRWWLSLTSEDIERGARSVIESPQYRAELVDEAFRWADAHGVAVDAAIVGEQSDRLDLYDRQRVPPIGSHSEGGER